MGGHRVREKVTKEALANRFAVELAAFHDVEETEVELTFVDGLVAVPGFVAISGKTPNGVTRGWVRKKDGLVVIIRHTSLTPLVEALRLADEPPPYDDDQVAEILTWGYGDRYTLLRSVKEGELGIRYALTAPPMREVRESDGAMVFRWLVRIEKADGPIIMHYQIERLVDGEHKYNGWQLAPKDPDYLDEDDEWTESESSPSSSTIADSKINNDEPWHQALVARSRSWLRFVQRGWSTKRDSLIPFIDAFSKTALWEHVPVLRIDARAPIRRGTVDDARNAVLDVNSRFALLDRGKNTYDDDTTAFIEVEISPRSATITTAVRGKLLASLGSAVLDDFFTMVRSLRDSVADDAHFASAIAFTTWKDNTPEPDLRSDWPLRSVAEVLQPTRPRDESGDAWWDAANTIAAAPVPGGVTRTTYKDLIELRWAGDLSDGTHADEAAVRHEAWVRTLVKTRPA